MDAIVSSATSTNSSNSLFDEQLAQIRADLAAVPAPPWRWIGVRGSGGPQLVTDHSGRQYLLRAARPVDARGDEILEPERGYVVYGDLEFRDKRDGERFSTMRAGNQLAVGRTSYDPDSIVDVNNPVARWMERSATHVLTLIAEIDRLREERHSTNEALADLTVAKRAAESRVTTLTALLKQAQADARTANAVGSDR